jgi:hypothetical protein
LVEIDSDSYGSCPFFAFLSDRRRKLYLCAALITLHIFSIEIHKRIFTDCM